MRIPHRIPTQIALMKKYIGKYTAFSGECKEKTKEEEEMFENLEIKETQQVNGGLCVAPVVYALEAFAKLMIIVA